jgi:hypothetical protein
MTFAKAPPLRKSAAVVLLLALAASCDTSSSRPGPLPPDPPAPSKYEATALKIADFLLTLQNEDGAIPDSKGCELVNEDSNMEYALLGLAAAYRCSEKPEYLQGLERGIAWLADREEMIDPRWRGSWYYAFSAKSPYDPVPVPIGKGIVNVRGVDATSALFVYLLYVHSRIAGSGTLSARYEENARAALDFIIAHNKKPDGSFSSSWQQWKTDRRWHLWPYCYSADQADVYLGTQAGWLLFADSRYRAAAAGLEKVSRSEFFSAANQRYALGRDEDGDIDLDFEGFNGIFPQGYLPWAFGNNPENQAACQWLQGRVTADGSLSCYGRDPLYSLSVAIYALAASALGLPPVTRSLDWLIENNYDALDGGVRDSALPGSEKYANVAGFTIMALLRFPTMLGAAPGSDSVADEIQYPEPRPICMTRRCRAADAAFEPMTRDAN